MAKDSSAKLFRLKWNNYVQNLSCLFESLFNEQKYVDVTLCCNGGTLKAHKVVLSACSAYFESIFRDHPCRNPVVIMNDVKIKEMQQVLEYMYKGELNVLEEELSSFVSAASLLDVRGLTNNIKEKNAPSEEPSAPVQDESNGMEIFPCETEELEILPVSAKSYNDNHNMVMEDESILGLDPDRQSTPLSFTDVIQDMLGRQSSADYNQHRTPERPGKDQSSYRVRKSNESFTTSGPETKRVKVKEEYITPVSPAEILEISDNQHGNVKETEDEKLECSVCKLHFMTQSLLQAHLQDEHNYTEDYRPHRCDFCPLAFYRSAHLKRHRRLHTGEKPFACELCGKCFSRQDKLKQHVQRHGPQLNPVSIPRGRIGRPRTAVSPRARPSRPAAAPNKAPFGDVSYLSSMSLASHRSDTISAEQLLRSVQDLGECIIQPCLPSRH